MTEHEIERLVVRLIGDAAGYESMLKQAEQGAQQTAQAVERSMGRIEASSVAAGVLAAGAMQRMSAAIFNSVGDVIGAWSEQEDANISLRATLRANGREVEKLFGDYDAFASKMQETTKLADEQVTALLDVAESYQVTGDAAKAAVKNAIALGKGSAESAQGMLRVTTAMVQGDVKRAMMFSRMIPQLRGVKNETEFLARFQKLVAAGLEATEKRASTFTGKLAQLKNVISDLYEDFGRIITEALKPFVDRMKQGVLWLKSLSDEAKKTIAVVAGLSAAFALGSVLVMIGRAIPLVGMLGSAIAGSLGLIPLLFTPIGAVLALAAAGVVILVQRLGGVSGTLEKIKGAAMAFWEFSRPMILQFGSLIKSVFEGFWDIAKSIFDNVARFAAWVWGGVGNRAKVTFENVKSFIVEAMIAAEFYVRNFGRFMALTWVNAELGVVRFANQVVYFFTVMIPGYVRWFAENFRDIMFTSVDWVLTVFINLGKNIRNLWTATIDFMSGEGWNFDFTPLTEGFRSTIKKLPNIAKREIGALEKSLTDESKNMTKSLAEDYLEFRGERLKDLADVPDAEKMSKPFEEFKESAVDATKAVEDLKDSVKPDAIRFDSAKAVQATEDYFDALREMGGKTKDALADVGGGHLPAGPEDAGVPPAPVVPAVPVPAKGKADEFSKLLERYAGKAKAEVEFGTPSMPDITQAMDAGAVKRLPKTGGVPVPTGVPQDMEKAAERITEIKQRSEEAHQAYAEHLAQIKQTQEALATARAVNLLRIKEEIAAGQELTAQRRASVREEQIARAGGGDRDGKLGEIANGIQRLVDLAEREANKDTVEITGADL